MEATVIEGYPFIIRFKTPMDKYKDVSSTASVIEGYPFIIRFKTSNHQRYIGLLFLVIEGYPFIIRFKTEATCDAPKNNCSY